MNKCSIITCFCIQIPWYINKLFIETCIQQIWLWLKDVLWCNKQFSQKSHVKSHIESVHNGVKFSCSHCNQQYSQQSGLNKHIKSNHEGFRYECKYCEYQATDRRYLKNHIQLKHEGNRYACNMCDQQFSFKNALIKHMQSTHDICMKSSKYTFEWVKHVKSSIY